MHRLLPRALEHLAGLDTTTDSPDKMEEFFRGVGLEPGEFLKPSDLPSTLNDASTWCDILQELVDSKEMSHAEMNRKRKRLTFQAFQREDISLNCIAIEILVEPNAHRMNLLFGRNAAIASLQRLPPSEAEHRLQLEQKRL